MYVGVMQFVFYPCASVTSWMFVCARVRLHMCIYMHTLSHEDVHAYIISTMICLHECTDKSINKPSSHAWYSSVQKCVSLSKAHTQRKRVTCSWHVHWCMCFSNTSKTKCWTAELNHDWHTQTVDIPITWHAKKWHLRHHGLKISRHQLIQAHHPRDSCTLVHHAWHTWSLHI
jgi:hypothetical protein